jgi:hypothetical protein
MITTSPSSNLDGSGGVNATSRLFTGGTNNTSYSVTVTVYSGSSQTGNSASATTSFTTLVSTTSTPTNVYVDTSGLVSWTASANAVTYNIEFYTAQNAAGLNASGPYTTSTSASNTSKQLTSPYASPNNYVRVRVNASNSSGTAAYSAWVPSGTTYT